MEVQMRKVNQALYMGTATGNQPKAQINQSLNLLYYFIVTNYQDFNFKHFKEYLESDENIRVSHTCVYHTLINAGITSPKIRKNTKKRIAKEKLMKEKKIENKTEEEIEIIVNHEVLEHILTGKKL